MFKTNSLKYNIALFILLIIGFLTRLYVIQIDPFLHNWDEHFHALVAKNLILHPFKPMLIANPIIPYKIEEWNSNHIWVHKQPLFLWQIALSIKLFGNSVLAVRVPSLIMTCLSILLVYRITYLFTKNYRTALISGLLICFSNYQFNLISGRYATDHNDVAFGFYVLCSFWAYIEYSEKPRWYWIVLIGLFSGLSILVKWLTGLLVYSAWGINVLFEIKNKNFIRSAINITIAFFITLIIFLPWQIYIFKFFPVETIYENEFNRRHLFEVLEGNGGGPLYYIFKLRTYYGFLVTLLFFYGIYISYKNKINKKIGNTLLIILGTSFIFFTIIVVTKMPAFMYCAFPIGFVYASVAFEYIFEKITNTFLCILILLIVLLETANPYNIWKHTQTKESAIKTHNVKILKGIDKTMPENTNIVLNLSNNENIDLMFFSNKNISAYQGVFTIDEIEKLKKARVPIAAFKSHGNRILPNYILNYPYLHILNEKLED